MSTVKKVKWALALSGGGAKGFAHLGVLTALEGLGFPRPSLVAGTSMGAIIGGLYACGMSPAEITRFTLEEFDISRYLDSFVFRLGGPVGRVMQTGRILGGLAGKRGIDSGDRLLALFQYLTGGRSFDQTIIPFRCNAADLWSGEEVVFKSGSVARAMRASMSFPVFFEPLMDGGRCLADGGLVDNIPVAIARNEGFHRVLAVDVGAFKPVPAEELDNAPRIVFRALELIQYRIQRQQERADLTIHAANSASPLSFLRKRELIALGERAVRGSIPALEAFFGRGPAAALSRQKYRECGIPG